MGSFSFLYSDREFNKDEQANMVYGDTVHVLIPKEFGGGYLQGKYLDYGKIECEDMDIDLYSIIALMNDTELFRDIGDIKLSAYDERNRDIRSIGIKLGDYENMSKVKYPLKIVKEDTDKTYEEIKDISIEDPQQGFYRYTWNTFDNIQSKNKEFIEKNKDDIKKRYTIL